MADERELESLRQENAALREQLARATLAAELYRDSTNVLLAQVEEKTPLTESAIRAMVESPNQRPLADIFAEHYRSHPE